MTQELTPKQELLRDVLAFIAEHGLSEITFGVYAIKDGRLVERLRRGGAIDIDKAAEVRRYMQSYDPKRLRRTAARAGKGK